MESFDIQVLHISQSVIWNDRFLQMTDVSNYELQSQKDVLSYCLKTQVSSGIFLLTVWLQTFFQPNFGIHFPMSVQCCLECLTDRAGMSAKIDKCSSSVLCLKWPRGRQKQKHWMLTSRKQLMFLKQFFGHLWQYFCHSVSECFSSCNWIQKVLFLFCN